MGRFNQTVQCSLAKRRKIGKKYRAILIVGNSGFSHLVQLAYGPEHSLASLLDSELAGSGGCVAGLHPDDVGRVPPELGHEPVVRVGQELDNVVVEGVHVFHQPLFTTVVHLSTYIGGREVSLYIYILHSSFCFQQGMKILLLHAPRTHTLCSKFCSNQKDPLCMCSRR